jgi:DNA modification methylase
MHNIVRTPVGDLKPNKRNARTHSKKQIQQLVKSVKHASGFMSPIVADENGNIIAGHGRLQAALDMAWTEVPVITLTDLTEAQKRALMLADNKIAGNAGWDREKLAIELPELSALLEVEGVDITVTGFEIPEIDQLAVDFDDRNDPEDTFEESSSASAVTQPGDVWILDQHRLFCGNARSADDVARLMGSETAVMAFLDPPYNVAVSGIGGRGKIKHPEFIEASGEMSPAAFGDFLNITLNNAARVSAPGSLHFICMDWRHQLELLTAALAIYQQHINTCIWAKSNPGQGSFYRSAHEMIGVFRVRGAPHLNNVELGRHGRNRSNVWPYPGVNTFRKGRMDDLRAHPTVKPVALVSDAMRDCTKRRDIVLDTFSGSGTTILAAERIGRRAFCMEIDPMYVDTGVRRWQALTGKDAILAGTTTTFNEIEAARVAAQKS